MKRWIAIAVCLAACGASAPPVAVVVADDDSDGDGVVGSADACPTEPEDLDGRHDDDGCPDADDDADGIADVDDVCPCELEDFDGWDDVDGCADPDDDGDRIVDVCDACPREPETYNGNCDEDGCPDTGHVCLERSDIRILERIYFRRGRATIERASIPIVDAIAQAMNGIPEIGLVGIIGHADPRERHGDELALRRAEALRTALIARGVEAARLVAEAGPPDASLPAEQQRTVTFEVRMLYGEPVDPHAPPDSGGGCASHTTCEVPRCDPTPTPPAC